MTPLYITYPTWKQAASDVQLVVYEQAVTLNTVRVWVGTRDVIYSTVVEPDDYADYLAVHPTGRVVVPSEDEAIALILGTATVLEPRDLQGRPAVAIETDVNVTLQGGTQGARGAPHYEKLTPNSNIDSGAFTDVYVNAVVGAVIQGLHFHVDTNRMDLQLALNGTTFLDLNLRDDVENGYKLETGSSSANGIPIGLCPYLWHRGSNRYVWEPPDVYKVAQGGNFTMRLRSATGNNRDLESGIVVWREES